MRDQELLASAVRFRIQGNLYVECRSYKPDVDSWAVTRSYGDVLNASGAWESEPLPSSRDDAFLARTRFTRDIAILLATTYAATHPLDPRDAER